jgi:hypothetical protein
LIFKRHLIWNGGSSASKTTQFTVNGAGNFEDVCGATVVPLKRGQPPPFLLTPMPIIAKRERACLARVISQPSSAAQTTGRLTVEAAQHQRAKQTLMPNLSGKTDGNAIGDAHP